MSYFGSMWFIEQDTPSIAHMFGLKRCVAEKKTPYQKVEIADNELFGRLLLLDSKIQSAAFDEYIYHEALVQPAMLLHEQPRRVLSPAGARGRRCAKSFATPP